MAHVLAEFKIVQKSQSNEASILAKELGLELQAKRFEKPIAEDAFKALSATESYVWKVYCPTRYAPIGTPDTKPIDQYAFDNIPVEVMRHWKSIKENYAFDRYEIWTTEKTPSADPLLIGVLGEKLFLLARWGLESPESMPFKEVAKIAVQHLWNNDSAKKEYSGFFNSKFRDTGHVVFNDKLFQELVKIAGWNPANTTWR